MVSLFGKFKNKWAILLALCVPAAVSNPAHAAVVTHGSTTGYQVADDGDWLSLAADDIDSSGGLGSDGHFFAGDFATPVVNSTGQPFNASSFRQSLPSYVTSVNAGANFSSIARQVVAYRSIDNPVTSDGTDDVGGMFAAGSSGASIEALTFNVSALAPRQTVRVGVLTGIDDNADGRWDPTSITLSDGTSSATVGGGANPLAAGGSEANWVFFDIDADGTYALSGTRRFNRQGVGFSGLTFDSVVAVPEPGSFAILGLSVAGMAYRRRRKISRSSSRVVPQV